MKRIQSFFRPPDIQAEGDRRMVLIVLIITLGAVILLFFANISRDMMGILSVFLLAALALAIKGSLLPAGLFAPIAGLLVLATLVFRNYGLRDTAMLGFPVIIVAVSLINGRRGTLVFGGTSLVIIAVLGLAEANGLVKNVFSANNTIADYLVATILIVLITALQWAVISRLNDNIHKAHQELAERRRAEEAQRKSESLYRFLMEESPMGIVIIDSQGRIEQVNPAANSLMGYKTNDLPGSDFIGLIDPISLAQNPIDVNRLQSGETLRMERLLICKDGSQLPVIGAGKQMPDGCYQYIFEDIREREKAEEAVRALNEQLDQRVRERTLELEDANQELESFSYSVSHDLRAPLRAINGFSNIIMREFSSNLDPQALRHLDTVQRNAKKMAVLIDDLLAFSRLGRNPLKKYRVDTRSLVAQVIEELRPEMMTQSVEWHISDLPACHADPALLHQVYANLIGNALKYSRPRPTAVIEIGSYGTESETTFFVRDNGVGFDMRYVNKLFGVFQRLHSEADFEGTGIGLATVHRIVNRHGGRIWAESEVDKGSIFYFTLGGTKQIPNRPPKAD